MRSRHEDEKRRQQYQAKDALELLIQMTRCYLVQQGGWRDLDARSRIVVNGVLGAFDRADLKVPKARARARVLN